MRTEPPARPGTRRPPRIPRSRLARAGRRDRALASLDSLSANGAEVRRARQFDVWPLLVEPPRCGLQRSPGLPRSRAALQLRVRLRVSHRRRVALRAADDDGRDARAGGGVRVLRGRALGASVRPDEGRDRRGWPPERRAPGGEPEFLRFSFHWGFRIRACRPYRARTKGKVERPVSYIRSNFFYARTFASDDDLNTRTLGWLDTVANVRIHGTLKEKPAERFQAERPHLIPLARWPYRPVVPRSEGQGPTAGATAGATVVPQVEVERRPLSAYARIAGEAP